MAKFNRLSEKYRVQDSDVAKDKSGDFRRLASSRTRAALDVIRKLENLSNRTNYHYDDAQVEKIFGALEEALQIAKAKFQKPTSKRFDL